MMRDVFFDNLKGALITLVVIGHFLLPMDYTRFQGTITFSIYLFHMPMFAFISGYFSKKIYVQGRFRKEKIADAVWFYFLFKAAVHVTENLAAGTPIDGHINFLADSGAPWYLMALVWWYLLLVIFSRMKPWMGLAITGAAGVLGGYCDFLGDWLALSRTVTFAPFFYAGYYCQEEQVKRFINDKKRWIFPALTAGILAVLAVGIGSFLGQKLWIVYGMNYRLFPPELYAYGGAARMVNYVCAVVMIMGVMAVMPKKKLPLWTALGERTIQVYILHRLLRDLMEWQGFYERFTSQYRNTVIFVALLAVVSAVLLANPWFAKMFSVIQKVPYLILFRHRRTCH